MKLTIDAPAVASWRPEGEDLAGISMLAVRVVEDDLPREHHGCEEARSQRPAHYHVIDFRSGWGSRRKIGVTVHQRVKRHCITWRTDGIRYGERVDEEIPCSTCGRLWDEVTES